MSFFDVALFATAFTTLTVIMDPIGTVPIFLGLTSRYSQHKQRRAAIQATSVSFGVILTFAILGGQILRLLHISMEALQLSGGVLLFLVAMELLMGTDSGAPDTGDENVNVALVPLGTPLLAGPGSIVAVILAHVVMWLTMRFSLMLSRLLGPGGIMLLTKISGLLLAAIATQLIMEGIFMFIASAQGS
mgnify:CR=1 FL=1